MPDSERICCPLCGWWRTVIYGIDQRTGDPREVRFDKVDLDVAPMWRKERLGGAGRGSSAASINLLDSKKLGELPAELQEQIKGQCLKILEILRG